MAEKVPDDASSMDKTPQDLDAILRSADEAVLDKLNKALDTDTGYKNLTDEQDNS